MSENTEEIVRDLMVKVLNKELPASGDIERLATPEWDSLKHIELIFVIEDTFSVNFDADELNELNSLQSLTKAISNHQSPEA